MKATIVIKEDDIFFFVYDFTKQSIEEFNKHTNIFNGNHKIDTFFTFHKDKFTEIYPSVKHILKWDDRKEKDMFDFDNMIKQHITSRYGY